jgi:Uma2 family endonuclease
VSLHEHREHHRFTVDDVVRMVEAGILGEDDRLELIDGELLTMSPQGPTHAALTVRIHRALERAFGAGHHVQDHSPIQAGEHTLPEPDVAVVRGELDAFLTRYPTGADVALVVEISVTTQGADRAKAAIYAGAGVPEYWNLDVPARRLVVYRDPRPERAEYAQALLLSDVDSVRVGGTDLAVGELLPPHTDPRSGE